MSLSRLEFILRETASNLARHGVMTAAAIGTAAVTLTVLGGFLLAAAMLANVASDQLERFEVMAYTRSDVTREQSLELLQRIRKLPDVSSARLITKEQAWAEALKKHGDLVVKSARDMKRNPMTDEFQVRAVSAEKTADVAQRLRGLAGIEEVAEARKEMEMVVSIARALKLIGIVTAVVMVLATTFIVSNSIRLTVFARRREIQIMQLVGATNGFIRMPFLLEGLFHGLAGAVLACAVVVYAVESVSGFLNRALPFLQSPTADLPLGAFCLSLALLGAAIGCLGSLVSIRKFLQT